MKATLTDYLCDSCSSHVQSTTKNGKIIFECQYCGKQPEDIQIESVIEEDE